MNSKNILISSLGLVPEIIEETIGFFNYSGELDFYKNSPFFEQISEIRDQMDLERNQVDELWLIATDKMHISEKGKEYNSTLEDFEIIQKSCSKYVDKIRIFILQSIPDITNDIEANSFHDLTLRVVSYGKSQTNGGKLYLSLACGRKTMSADMQDAAYCFGCDALIHVLGNSKKDAFPVSLGKVVANEALGNFEKHQFEDKEIMYVRPQTSFHNQIQQQKEKSQHFYTTYYLDEQETRSNFHILYTLPPSKINELKESKLGIDIATKAEDTAFLRKLPKTDLHCHLGGVLSPAEMIEVAKCYIPDIENEKKKNVEFYDWCLQLSEKQGTKEWKKWRKELSKRLNVPEGLIVASFLLSYQDNVEELTKLLYGEYENEAAFCRIGIDKYEALGDLQGSALLCNENAVRRTVQILLANCIKENILYLEIRCSPINYATEQFTAQQVLLSIFEELEKVTEVETSILLIASRHGDLRKVEESIQLARQMKGNPLFDKYFRGFDLAGDEGANSPKQLHDKFLEVMRDCLNITIHAGEDMPSENIWEAVYYLNAERIGHGLTLTENRDLMIKFLERGIGIEMCPSSNYQIVGYRDNYFPETSHFPTYPLAKYLSKELKVSINTDDPGISRTNSTNELLRAARLTQGGLSKWDILQLICNGFRTAFYPYEQKKGLIRKAENMIGELIEKQEL